jgi:hypothetical protein
MLFRELIIVLQNTTNQRLIVTQLLVSFTSLQFGRKPVCDKNSWKALSSLKFEIRGVVRSRAL